MKVFPRGVCSLLLLVLGGLSMNSAAEGEAPYSGSVGQNYPKEVFFGDTHLHTRNSADAWSMGNLNLTPGDAYRFAQGSPVLAHNGMQVQLRRPLDFLVVSDHAEYLGAFYRFNVNDSLITKTDVGRQWQTYVE